jgi:hypothetical protein
LSPSDAGIIFVTADDPISKFTVAITKQEYSSIGFFCPTTISGYLEILVILIDVFGTGKPSWIVSDSYTLNDLLTNHLVKKVAIKKLRPIYKFKTDVRGKNEIDTDATSRLHARFRIAITELQGDEYDLPLIDAIYQLFGHPIPQVSGESPHPPKKSKMTAVEMVNKVIYSMGEWDKVPQNGSLNMSQLKKFSNMKEVSNDASGKLQIISMLGAPFIQQEVPLPSVSNKLIQSYIVNNDLFEDLIEIPIPSRDLVKMELAKNDAIKVYRNYLVKIIATTIDEMLKNPAFFDTVIRGINQTQKIKEAEKQSLETYAHSLGKCSQTILKFIGNMINSGYISGTELGKLTEHLNNILSCSSEYLDAPLRPVAVDIPTRNCYIEFRKLQLKKPQQPVESEEKTQSRETSAGKKTDALRVLNTTLLSIVNAVHNNRKPIIDLQSLIDATNALNDGSQPLIGHLKESVSIPALVVNQKSSVEIPILLDNGRDYTIPAKGADLTAFTLSELKEIAKILNNKNDERFAQLQIDIMKRIAFLNLYQR